jgi:hypothetical protein
MITEETRPPDDVKEMMIAGCHVRLAYGRSADARWTVNATVMCGIEDKTTEQSVVTCPFETRESAEQDALQQIASLLGHQTDRSHSRVRNWT